MGGKVVKEYRGPVIGLALVILLLLLCSGGVMYGVHRFNQRVGTSFAVTPTGPGTSSVPTEDAKDPPPIATSRRLPRFLLDVPTSVVPPAGNSFERLAARTLLDLDQAIKSRDFTAFHGTLCKSQQDDSTPMTLRMRFQQFIATKVDLSGVRNVAPVFNAKPMIVDGVLTLDGRFPSRPFRVGFKLDYVMEQSAWKLAGWDLVIEEAGMD
jgi:hypothetical protein